VQSAQQSANSIHASAYSVVLYCYDVQAVQLRRQETTRRLMEVGTLKEQQKLKRLQQQKQQQQQAAADKTTADTAAAITAATAGATAGGEEVDDNAIDNEVKP
jgi:hypothetical protein